ncbi:MAG: replicative DNA helicase [Bacilli bacterium]|nr:replicative DNA helicase [Bacilli bacterium]
MKERTIPHNIGAEQSVIGAMFLSKYALEKGLEALSKDVFYLDAHGKIFEVLSELSEKNRAIDITTVTEGLEKKGYLKQIGGVEYLSEIISMVPSASNVDEYIHIVEEKAILRRLIDEAGVITTEALTSQEDINEVLDKAEKRILNVVKTRKGTEFKPIADVLIKAQADLEKLSKNRGEVTGLSTGFYDLDKVTSGLHGNELIIIAARPAMGKTAFALNLAYNLSKLNNKAVAVFNMEMSAEQLVNRMLCSAGQINQGKMKNARFDHEDWKKLNEACSKLAETQIYIDDTPGMAVSEIKAKSRRLASSTKNLGAIVIDYLQLISGGAKYAGNRQQEVSEISRSLKTLAMELEVPVIALAQLSRSVEGRDSKKPILSDLRESGSIEQDADIVAFLYREDYYNKEAAIDEYTSRSEFIIGKHRSGPTTTIDLIFKRDTSTFVSMVHEKDDAV